MGGAIAQRRRLQASEAEFRQRIEQADRDLAAAHAEDNGWDRARLEEAARRVFAEQHADAQIEQLALVQVIDNPGTASDQAVFTVRSAGTDHRVVLGRSGDDWIPA